MTYYVDLTLAHISGWIVSAIAYALIMAWLEEKDSEQ